MLNTIQFIKPEEIERKSMELIETELGNRNWLEPEYSIIKRCIHTSADFDYADQLTFSKDAAKIGVQAVHQGAHIVTDTSMAAAGINEKKLKEFGGALHCFIKKEELAKKASSQGVTRASLCMEEAITLSETLIFAIGNAPTALIRLYELIQLEKVKPALIIGVPVGFVNVIEAKELIMKTNIPYIVAKGRKGGSNIAAAICNALLYYEYK